METNKIGRPRKGPKNRKTKMYNLMLTPTEQVDLPELAEKTGYKTVASFLREAIHYYAKFKIDDPNLLCGSTFVENDWGTPADREMASDR